MITADVFGQTTISTEICAADLEFVDQIQNHSIIWMASLNPTRCNNGCHMLFFMHLPCAYIKCSLILTSKEKLNSPLVLISVHTVASGTYHPTWLTSGIGARLGEKSQGFPHFGVCPELYVTETDTLRESYGYSCHV